MALKLEIVVVLAFLMTFSECQFSNCADNDTIDLESDSYQYLHGDYPSSPALYREWWFFAFYDPSIDVGFCVGYNVADPGKKYGLQEAIIGGILWTSVINNTSQQPIYVFEPYPYEQFSGYKENASVNIGKENFIKVLDEKTYQLIGNSRSGGVRWSLTFQQKSYSCKQIDRVPLVLETDWISYMPSAYVSGTIQYYDKIYSINATGYHDHNYGAWPLNLFNWIWAQFHRVDREFSLVLGSYHIPTTEDDYMGYVFIRWRGQRIKFGTLCGDEFHLMPLEWKIIDGKKYSTHNKVQAWNKQYKIEFEYKTIVGSFYPGESDLGLKVFEQISQYDAVLYAKSGQNWIILEQNLTGHGFNEWCNMA